MKKNVARWDLNSSWIIIFENLSFHAIKKLPEYNNHLRTKDFYSNLDKDTSTQQFPIKNLEKNVMNFFRTNNKSSWLEWTVLSKHFCSIDKFKHSAIHRLPEWYNVKYLLFELALRHITVLIKMHWKKRWVDF